MKTIRIGVVLTAALLLVAATPAAAPATAAAVSAVPAVDVLSYNVMLLPRSLYPNWGQMKRADLIAAAPILSGHDVVVLQEMFDNGASDRLKAGLAGRYPHQTPVLGRSRTGWDTTAGAYADVTPEDGGVVVASRWPILERIQYVFADGCGADRFSNKGFVYVRLTVSGATVHVVGTHAQADDTACPGGSGAATRARQFAELDAFLDARAIPAHEQVIIAGDLNVDRHGPEWAAARASLGVAEPRYAGHPYSWDAQLNGLADYNDDADTRQQLDHVVHRDGHARPAGWTSETHPVTSPRWSVTSWFTTYTYDDYADHYPVVGRA
ncbi:sphingomyelin phosphodiesterase [Actinoplanes sp. NEAU-A12]|uniref:Sphingomyelin phosphodiesterase n=1 Tax=Actinoplanes sandaracinus TaxID=3045177 RepID=A0ABT6WM88_9ACTN|nr:sphingomyelin phosphodiesterase [Actinoplanes sandaracinus]MDI6100853.1 sphingomyelin phosphodiesterase [Actinoplanes sandaracinus]